MILAMSTVLDLAVLVLAWRISGGRFNTLPSGPFALVLALWSVRARIPRPETRQLLTMHCISH